MTDTERKALALVNEVAAERGTEYPCVDRRNDARWEALCRAIEQHEAFRQEVSDAVVAAKAYYEVPMYDLSAFIIAKPDPLVEAMQEACGAQGLATKHTPGELTEHLRAAIEKRGGKIIFNEE